MRFYTQAEPNITYRSNEKIFFFLLTLLIAFCSYKYDAIINDSTFNLFPLIANVILLSLFSLFKSSVLKKEIFRLFFVGIVFSVLNLVEHDYYWMEVSLLNFYSLMYILFFYCYAQKIQIENRLQKGYTCFINYFLVFYIVLLDVSIVMNNYSSGSYLKQMHYIDLGIKIIILFISIVTLLSFLINKILNRVGKLGKKSFVTNVAE